MKLRIFIPLDLEKQKSVLSYLNPPTSQLFWDVLFHRMSTISRMATEMSVVKFDKLCLPIRRL